MIGGRVAQHEYPQVVEVRDPGLVARSSAVAKVYAIVQAGRQGLGARQLLHDLGWEGVSVEIRSDALASCNAPEGNGGWRYEAR